MSAPGYDAATRSAALADRSGRTRIVVTGPDRAKVLHNLTTNDVKRLEPGRGREAFVTSGQGKTLALVTVHAGPGRLLVRSDPGTAAAILAHAGKYGVFDDATFEDIGAGTAEWHLVGPELDATLARVGLTLPADDLGIAAVVIAGVPVSLIRERPTGRPGVTLIAAIDDARVICEAIDLPDLSPDAFETLRIEAGTPIFGRDVTPANLPQEVGRDARAISFVKGCYLGQETVARLDALGHVNKILIGAIADEAGAESPAAGSPIRVGGLDVGTVTSSAPSPGWGRAVILGYVKVAHATPGTPLVVEGIGGPAGLTVRPLPMLPPG